MRRRVAASAPILAALALVVAAAGCSSVPWSGTRKTEVNVSFELIDNLPVVGFSYSGSRGHGILATSRARSVFDSRFAGNLEREGRLRIGAEHVVRIDPVVDDLGGLGDALIAGDAFRGRTLTIDWRAGLATVFTRTEPLSEAMHRWTEVPAIPIEVDGESVTAVIDTSSPDSLTLPGPARRRYEASVVVAGVTNRIDIAVDPRVTRPRLGNRILAHHIVQIDYRRRTAALWRY